MDHTYVDQSNQPFVLVDLDDYPDIDLREALNAIMGAGVYPEPHILLLQGQSFSGDTDGLTAAQKRTDELLGALAVIEKFQNNATFMVGIDVAEQAERADLLDFQFPRTLSKLQDRDVPGKRLVLVTVNGKAEKHFSNFQFGRGRFHREGTVLSSTFKDLENALRAAPEPGKSWSFADDEHEQWVDQIDKLTEDEIHRIVADGLHLPAVKRMRAALREAQGRFEKRHHALEMLVACALARVNLVFLGPPGTAKSLMVRTFSQTLGVRPESRPIKEENAAARQASRRQSSLAHKRRMFEYLLTRYTTPEEIFGGADINLLLAAGVHGRRTEGMLPQAETAFLDEIFKANSAILNTLLSITNERLFYNLGQAFRVNLAFVVGASNETPSEDELGALYDRFPIRVPCRPVEASQLKLVIRHAHNFESAAVLRSQKHQIYRHACLNDLRLLSKVVQGGICGGSDAFGSNDAAFEDHFHNLLLSIRRDYGVSDRTPVQVLRLCRALALLEEASTPQLGPRHLRAWGYVAPKLAAAGDLQRIVKARIQQLDPQAPNLFDEI